MGTIRKTISCPNCAGQAVEIIDVNKEFKIIECDYCTFRKEYVSKIKWIEKNVNPY